MKMWAIFHPRRLWIKRKDLMRENNHLWAALQDENISVLLLEEIRED